MLSTKHVDHAATRAQDSRWQAAFWRTALMHGWLRPHRVSDGAQVTAILVLFALPWLLTGSILAHELMHAWLRLSGLTGLSLDVEEGLCQLLALLWLEQQPAEPEVC